MIRVTLLINERCQLAPPENSSGVFYRDRNDARDVCIEIVRYVNGRLLQEDCSMREKARRTLLVVWKRGVEKSPSVDEGIDRGLD